MVGVKNVDNKLCVLYSIFKMIVLCALFILCIYFPTRFFPERQYGDAEIMVHRLLSLFHSRPFVQNRFAPQGSVACIRAYNTRYLDIVFRHVYLSVRVWLCLNDHLDAFA